MDLKLTFYVTFVLGFVFRTTAFFIRNPPDVVIKGGGPSSPVFVIQTNDTTTLSCEIEAPLRKTTYQWQCRSPSDPSWSNCGSSKTTNVTVDTTEVTTFYQCLVSAVLGNKTVSLVSETILVLPQTDHNNVTSKVVITKSSLNHTVFIATVVISVVEFVVICGLLLVHHGRIFRRNYKLSLRKGHNEKDHGTKNGILEDGVESPPLKMRRRNTTDSVDDDGYILPIQLGQNRTCVPAKCKTDPMYMELRGDEDEKVDDEDTYEIPAGDPLYENVSTLLRAETKEQL